METVQREELETREWKERMATGESLDGVSMRKEFPASFQKAAKNDDQPDTRLVDFVLNTGGADRYSDTIKGDGWELENYLANPVVLWHHNSSAFAGPAPMPHAGLPVARGANLEVIGDSLIGSAEFYSEAGENPSEAARFIETVFQMVKGGFLNAVSVGFEPLEWTYDEERGGYNFIRQELLEFSVVPIPADSGALRRARELGIDTQPIYQWATELLESGDEIPVHRQRLEAVAKGLGLGRGMKLFDMSAVEIKSTIKERLKVSPEELAEAKCLLTETQAAFEEQNGVLVDSLLQIEHLEDVVQDLAKKRAEELVGEELTLTAEEESAVPVGTISEVVKEACEREDREWTKDPKITFLDENDEPMAIEDIVAARQKEAPVDQDNAIVLRLVEEEVTAESEEALQVDPEEVKEFVAARVGDELQEIKRLFTKMTGKVIR